MQMGYRQPHVFQTDKRTETLFQWLHGNKQQQHCAQQGKYARGELIVLNPLTAEWMAICSVVLCTHEVFM